MREEKSRIHEHSHRAEIFYIPRKGSILFIDNCGGATQFYADSDKNCLFDEVHKILKNYEKIKDKSKKSRDSYGVYSGEINISQNVIISNIRMFRYGPKSIGKLIKNIKTKTTLEGQINKELRSIAQFGLNLELLRGDN